MHTIKRILLPVSLIILLAILNMPVFAQPSGLAVLDSQVNDIATSPLSDDVLLQYVNLTSPINNFTTTNPEVVFSWEPVYGVTYYQLQISYESSFTFVVRAYDHTLSATSDTFRLPHTGTFYWRVRDTTYDRWSSVRQFTIQPMSPPSSLAPTNALTVSDPNVTFSWGAITYATHYQIQISNTNTSYLFHTGIVHDATVTPPSYNYVFSMVGTYYWRVRARNGNVEGTWSSVYQLTVQSDSAPTILAPHNQAISYSPTFILTWSPVSGATEYDIQIAKDFNFTTIVEQHTTTNTSSTYTFSLYNRYYWRVRMIGGLWSQSRTMTFAFIPFSGGTTTFLDMGNDFSITYFRDTGQSIFIESLEEYDILTQTRNDLLIEEGVAGLGSTTGVFVRDISLDGRYALIETYFEGLYGAYRYDRVMGTIALVSKDSDGNPMGPEIYTVDISDDGNLSLFIIQEMINQTIITRDYFLHNSETGQTTQVSTLDDPQMTLFIAFISPNSRYIAMIYGPTDGTGLTYLYLYDIETQVLQPVMTPNNTPVTTAYFQLIGRARVVFYGDDRYVVFNSPYPEIMPDATNTGIYIYDIQTGLFEPIRITSNDGYNGRIFEDITPDGRYMVFAGGLDYQLYVYDRQQGTTTHVSINSNGVAGSLSSQTNGRISPDGNHVVFNGTLEHYGVSRLGTHIYTLPSDLSVAASGQGAFSPARLSSVGSGSLTTEFRWTAIRGILDYQIQISTDIEFNNILYDVDVTTTSHTQTFTEAGTYYWRVRGKNAWGDGLWSETFHIILGEGATIAIDEQVLFNMAQPHLTHDMTSVLFDITPTGIITTAQFGNGGVVTTTIKLSLINGIVRVTLEWVTGGNATQQSAMYEVIPALIMTILDESLPDDYLVIESIGLTGSGINVNLVMPSNP